MVDRRRLSEIVALLPGGGQLRGTDPTIGGVTHDSRMVAPGDLFVAIPGAVVDGHDYVERAVAAGAAAVLAERPVDAPAFVLVDDARAALAWAAAAVYGDPSSHLSVIGVTGTNGKTTVTHMVDHIVTAAGVSGAVVGTIGARIGTNERSVTRTTPEASDLQRLLSDMVEAGIEVTAIEVSSHALSLHRVDAIRFRIAAFTNLMQDHLDFHGTMDAYLGAKASLFTASRADHAVIMVDGDAGIAIASATDVPTTTVALTREADVTASHIVESLSGSTFVVNTAEATFPVDLPMPGRFNVANALVASAIALQIGIGPEAIARGLASIGTIAGRFERVESTTGFDVIVDYAHTPDAVAEVVAAARRLVPGRVIVVFGAGGDRDREKRPAMGRAAGGADVAILTSDNPRTEDPSTIMKAVRSGIPPESTVIEIPDRRTAIRTAVEKAAPGDLVLILGKGHETGQDFGDRVEPFDDRIVAREELAALAGGGPS